MENKKAKNVLLAIMGVLIVVLILARVTTFGHRNFAGALQLIALVFVVLYGFWFYKKPHGNMLKYTMLIYAATAITESSFYLAQGETRQIAKIIAATAICYGAGRLNRIDENKYLFPIIDAVLLIYGINLFINNIGTSSVMIQIRYFSNFIIFTTLMIAYFVRFEEHKAAGLIDTPKK